MTRIDVTVRGAGIFGLSCAWACLRRGARVRVIDPNGVAAGSSGGLVGALAPHVPGAWNAKKQFQLESLLMAADWWAEIETESGLSAGYGRTGRLQPLADGRAVELARSREGEARTHWGGHADWTVVQRSGPFVPVSPSGMHVLDTLSARIHPRKACLALAGAIGATGGEVVPDGPEQGSVIHATGVAGLEEMSALWGRTAGNGVKGQAALLAFDAGAVPQVFAEGVHIVPHADGTVAVGSTSERDYTDPTTTDDALDAVIARAMAAVPALRGTEVLERWAGVRPRARSRAPILGRWPERPGHFIANGGFKIGFGMAPGVGEVMADLVLEGRDRIPEEFRVSSVWGSTST
ncbi:oxidoreductase, FAD-binding [Pseudooceanicola batsensis HTCC2597]|uniref:Oxidoreductase, FAD-binding n=1 Tax=Pseudooceanicola batsensis (strain ATCC BAA-863 / DSM 15984 / KCTC 12145 / HTCC2597) TaxID=252305 RepID=A3TWJ1_PSEBH|nr:FAD-dependent oxidoreductase [Pseudooceanicola batsensis]EAQ03987.1 oxidoreductase, FAD-binding [Pseudooceanicola batsensis HTCC2597]